MQHARKELEDANAQALFEDVRRIKQIKDVVILSHEGQALHGSMTLSEGELRQLSTLFDDYTKAFEEAFLLQGERYEVHQFHPYEGLVYGRRGKGGEDSVGVALIKNFSNVMVLVTYGFPFLSARVIPLVLKELQKY